jgi:hypothetical protein
VPWTESRRNPKERSGSSPLEAAVLALFRLAVTGFYSGNGLRINFQSGSEIFQKGEAMDTGHDWRPEEARKSLSRILPEVEQLFSDQIREAGRDWHQFKRRLYSEWERLFICLHQLYGWQYDFFYTLHRILHSLVKYWLERPSELKQLDARRETGPFRYVSGKMVGGVLYVDLFSDNLSRLADHIPYFKKLGLPLPAFNAPVRRPPRRQ